MVNALNASPLPVLDLASLADGVEPDAHLARALDRAFTEVGFCYVTSIGVAPELRDRVFEASRAFHALPRAAKQAIAINEFHRGYMAPRSSVIRTSSVARNTHPNLSESFMAMHEVAPGNPE